MFIALSKVFYSATGIARSSAAIIYADINFDVICTCDDLVQNFFLIQNTTFHIFDIFFGKFFFLIRNL